MSKLSNGLYCRKKILEYAKSTAKTAQQMARKLIPGVFTKEAQMRCTLTGQAVRSLGPERKNEATKTLNVEAVETIISKIFSKNAYHQYWLKILLHNILFF